MSDATAWTSLALMGAYHGLNPAMGWLFAVALGFQERSTGAVLRALPPLALGHAASIAVVVAAVGGATVFISPDTLRLGSAMALLAFAAYLIVRRNTHPRWVGMRVGFKDLTLWSFLMSSAHGAGLMLVPVLLHSAPAHATIHATTSDPYPALHGTAASGLAAVAVHTVSLWVVMATVALLVFRTLGLGALRRLWINLDAIWVGALVVAGIVTLVLP